MSINILHVSDLHFRAPAELNKNICQSNEDFCDEFIGYIKEDIGKIDYLIFTGDAINQGYLKAFDDATRFLNRIIDGLSISKDRVLLCMGNHDFNRNELIEEEQEIPVNIENRKERVAMIPFNNTKYKHFKKLVNDVCKKDLNVKDAIYDKLVDRENKFILFGVNTCYLESYEETSHKGAIDKKQFIHKLKEHLKDNPDYNLFLAMHHNPNPEVEGNEVKDWTEMLLDIQKERIKNPIVVFSGHIHYIDTGIKCSYEHYGESNAIIGKQKGIYYFSAGSLLATDYKSPSFNLYEIDNNTITYYFHARIDPKEKPFWKQIEKGEITIEEQDVTSVITKEESEGDNPDYPGENKQKDDKLEIMKYVGEHGLYYSGHFHWNTDENTEKSDFKSHGYIDINYLVSHNESLDIITRLFRTEIDGIINLYKEKLGKTLLVAIGMECNVIGARLSILFPDFDFSYLTRKYKAKDYNDIENGTALTYGDYDTIILIKDIMVKTSKGDTVEIIRDKFYGRNVHLISLFYCGGATERNAIKRIFDTVQFHPLIEDIKIPICDVEEEKKCPIVEYKLQTIYKC